MSTTYKALVTGGAVLLALIAFGVYVLLAERGVLDLGDLRGRDLERALGERARAGHEPLAYGELWEALAVTDASAQAPDRVLLFYSGRAHPIEDRVSSRLNPDHGPDSWNREHIWPRSRGIGDTVAASDLHHVRPTDVTCNSARGSRAFDRGGEPIAECLARVDQDSFEPRDAVKGDVARMLFYMDVRYDGADGEPDLRLIPGRARGPRPSLGHLCTLLDWHLADPLDGTEIDRHTRIAERQGNRNPFIDRPDLATQLYASRCP